MDKTKEKNTSVWKNASVSFLKIFGVIVCAYIFVLTVVFSLFPGATANYFKFFGATKAEELCYERQYQKTNDIADLYNLILFEQDRNNLKQLQFINELRSKKEYEDFCKKLNDSALSDTTEKSLVAYVGDVNAYLVNQKVKCLYKLNLGCEVFIYTELKSGKLTEQSFASYAELVYTDKSLTKEQKIAKYHDLIDTAELDGQTLEVLLNNRLLALNEKVSEENLQENEEIILKFTLAKDYKACYYVYSTLGNEVKTSEFMTKYNEAIAEYNNIIK